MKPNDPGMILLTKKIERLKEALTKPKEVLIEYNDLLRIAKGKEALLRILEQNYEAVKLEKAKISKPWNVISQPRLKERPIGPKRLSFIFNSLIISTFFGVVTALFYNKKKGYLFSLEEHKKFLDGDFIPIQFSDKSGYGNDLGLYLKNKISLKIGQKLAFLTVSDECALHSEFESSIKSLFKRSEFTFTRDLSEILNYDYIFLIIIEGHTNKEKLLKIKNSVNISGIKLFSSFYIF